MQDITSFLEPVAFINEDGVQYHPLQWGAHIKQITAADADADEADIILVGCGEWRGTVNETGFNDGADAVRRRLYEMYNWHSAVRMADAGNVKRGATADDTRAALLMVLQEIHEMGKVALIIGGSHDLTMQQYNVFRKKEKMAVAAVADMYIDLDESEETTDRSFLMDMLTDTPNFIGHYSHMAFQSYYTHPRMLETLDKLRFDFFRLGKVREDVEEMEPVLRSSDFFSFDLSAVKYSDCPSNLAGSPNGLSGEEACSLTRYAGMSNKLTSIGIYGYKHADDPNEMSARLVAQMIWYFADGYLVRKNEASLKNSNEFMVFEIRFSNNDTTFMKSKRTSRWWMQLPDGQYVPCSYNDYLTACNDDLPERWLREQERLM